MADYRWLSVLIDLAQFIAIGLVALAGYSRKPGADAMAELPKIRERLTALEQAQLHLASETDVHALRATVQETAARVEAMQQAQARTNTQLDRIESYLLHVKQ